MIHVGTDIVSIERIVRMKRRYGDRFLNRFLYPEEIASAKSDASLAGLWAGKEALSKALGCGIGEQLTFHDMRIVKTPKGAPEAVFSPEAVQRFGIQEHSVSITHDGGFAVAVAVVVRPPRHRKDTQ
ncbi:holo-ACP synthase [Nitratifractor sp.]